MIIAVVDTTLKGHHLAALCGPLYGPVLWVWAYLQLPGRPTDLSTFGCRVIIYRVGAENGPLC